MFYLRLSALPALNHFFQNSSNSASRRRVCSRVPTVDPDAAGASLASGRHQDALAAAPRTPVGALAEPRQHEVRGTGHVGTLNFPGHASNSRAQDGVVLHVDACFPPPPRLDGHGITL